MSILEPVSQQADGPAALAEPTLCAAFQRTAAERPDDVALRTAGDAVRLTWREYAARVRSYAEGLHALGVRRGDTVALRLANRPEFHLLDAAALHLGAVPFSIYGTSSPEQVEFQVRDAGARVVVGDDFAFDELDRLRSPGFDFDAAWRAVDEDDLVTLIYTSGTTGPPKGVEITHRNVLAAWRGMHRAWGKELAPGRVISYLPSAHIADRFSTHYAAILFGHAVTCCPDPRQVGAALAEARPTQFASVPRVWQKLRAAVEPALPPAGDLPAPMAAAIRERLGLDCCEVAITAAAPAPEGLFAFFDRIGVELCEVYGLSETAAVATANVPGARRAGTVGRAMPGVDLRVAADGEVLVRGDVVMRGYRNRPDQTTEAIDADGWLHTGDVGTLDDDGYLRIVDRKKELIINSAGKNMSPANIESALKDASGLIGHACVIGDGRPYNVALLTVDAEAARAAAGPPVAEALAAAVERANARLSRVEQVKRFLVLEHDWQPGGVELTPTMKLKRRAIAERYAEDIEALYGGAR